MTTHHEPTRLRERFYCQVDVMPQAGRLPRVGGHAVHVVGSCGRVASWVRYLGEPRQGRCTYARAYCKPHATRQRQRDRRGDIASTWAAIE